jgi:hypothetical protein
MTRRVMDAAVAGAIATLGVQASQAAPLAAWVEFVGPERAASVRAITPAGSCPDLQFNGSSLAMHRRAGQEALFPDDQRVPKAKFDVQICEADAPSGTGALSVDGTPLTLPADQIKRIVILGDTGCRIKGKKKTQDCGDPTAWPYAKIAERAASSASEPPDLVIHVGDYLYREKPCSGAADCPNSPTGYGWDVWYADFFKPSAPLFEVAPWIMVRGNHETCHRAGEGWFRFLDSAKTLPVDKCPDVTAFLVVSLGGIGFVAVDSALLSDGSGSDADDDDEGGPGQPADLTETMRRHYNAISASVPAKAWVLTHAPFNAVRVGKDSGQTESDNAIQQQALGASFTTEINMIVSGHIHLFEAFGFGRDHPPQLVVGTGGDKLAKKPDKPTEINGLAVTNAVIWKGFGYMLWERDGSDASGWRGTLFDEKGVAQVRCQLANRDLSCAKDHDSD